MQFSTHLSTNFISDLGIHFRDVQIVKAMTVTIENEKLILGIKQLSLLGKKDLSRKIQPRVHFDFISFARNQEMFLSNI